MKAHTQLCSRASFAVLGGTPTVPGVQSLLSFSLIDLYPQQACPNQSGFAVFFKNREQGVCHA